MREPWRSNYLQAMGVAVYVPRLHLPGAAPSRPVLWDVEALAKRPPAVIAPAAMVEEPDSSDQVRIQVERHQPPSVSIVRELAGGSPAVRAETAVERTAATSPVPRFALQIVRADIGVLLIDDAPVGGRVNRGDYQRFIGNLLLALFRQSAQLSMDPFIWPMVKNPSVDQGEQAARESLGAYVQRQASETGCERLILLGATAQQWVVSELPALAADSAWPCIGSGAAKHALWRQLASQMGR